MTNTKYVVKQLQSIKGAKVLDVRDIDADGTVTHYFDERPTL